MFNQVKVKFFAEMPIDGVNIDGRNTSSKGSNTPGFSNLTPDTGTDVDGSGGQEWIQIVIPILVVIVLLLLILPLSVRWVSNFIFFSTDKVNILLKKKCIFDQQKYIKKVPYFTCY